MSGEREGEVGGEAVDGEVVGGEVVGGEVVIGGDVVGLLPAEAVERGRPYEEPRQPRDEAGEVVDVLALAWGEGEGRGRA